MLTDTNLLQPIVTHANLQQLITTYIDILLEKNKKKCNKNNFCLSYNYNKQRERVFNSKKVINK